MYKSKAVIARNSGEKVEEVEILVPEPGPNEVLIKISKDLVSLKVDAPMPLALNSLKIKPIDINKILEFT